VSGLVVDTSSWILYFKGREYPSIDEALKHGQVFLPVIVAAELMSGQIPASKRAALSDFLADLPSIDNSLNHWFRVGELRQKAAAKGVHLSTPDAHIAQCCIDMNAKLISEDGVFKRLRDAIPQLPFHLA
jgi:predicted nucleic acid-binding protein